MDLTESVDVACSPGALLEIVDDLAGYPRWLTIVPVADLEADVTPSDGDEGGDGPAWSVELRGHLGPMARSKRLRMVRTRRDGLDGSGRATVRFERRELDGRTHAPWVLDAVVEPGELGSRLTMHLHYGGGFGTGVLERLLRAEIARSRPRLRQVAEDPATDAG